MTGLIYFRPLVQGQDIEAVQDLFLRATDYAVLEDGVAPDATKAEVFFNDCVPGGDLSQAVKLGAVRDGHLLGLADMGFGYPSADDAYIGLLLFDPAVRGQGLGHRMLRELNALARERGATRLLVAVLEANPKGKAFWTRKGFALERVFEPEKADPMQHRRFRMTRAVFPP